MCEYIDVCIMPKTPAGRRFCHFVHFGVKRLAAYRVSADILKPSAGRRFGRVLYIGVKRLAARRVSQDTLKPSAGRRFGQCFILLGLSVWLLCHVFADTLKPSAGRRLGHFSLGRGAPMTRRACAAMSAVLGRAGLRTH